jgi:hypothetical protein
MYDKRTGKTYHALIGEVAQKKRFYKPEVERGLNTDVEIAGTDAIKRLIEGLSLSDRERQELSGYIATMIKRVPYHRSFVEATLYPDLLARKADEYRNKLRALTTGGVPIDVVKSEAVGSGRSRTKASSRDARQGA